MESRGFQGMTKKLLLLRHGKSDWPANLNSEDRERPLASRGRRAARRIGRFLTAVDSKPDAVITSAAVRARTTVELAAEAGDWKCPIQVSETLYEAAPQDVLAEIRSQPSAPRILLVAGHEPTWSELLSLLIGGGDIKIVTASVARVELPINSWGEADFGHAILDWLVTPKLLERAGFL